MNHFATHEDLPELLRLFSEWALEIGCETIDDIVAEIKPEIENLISHGAVFVHRSDDKIDGMIGVNVKKQAWRKQPTLYEQFFFVSKPARGNGVLPFLLGLTESYASIRGCGNVILNPHEGTDKPEIVAKVLERYGYAVTGYNMGKKIDGLLRHNNN